LHWKDPKNYPDANHKPEIAIALTELAMLNGFKPLPELLSTFEQIPELAACMPTELLSALRTARTADQQQLALRELYRALLLSELPSRKAAMQRLRQRLPEGVAGLRWELPLLQQMFENYGEGDVGVPTALLMNWLKIPAGAAVFIGPNQLHAYLQGDILECMANSDNVVRAGLTPKFQDTQELLAMAAVVPGLPSSIQPTVIAESTICKRYPCPAEEFCVQQILGDAGQSEKFSRDSVSLLLCTSGRIEVSTKGGQHTLTEGQLVLLPATAKEFRVTLHGGQAAAYASPVVPQGVLVGVGDARSEA
jgi:mannose-6-phosphate isomerase